MQLAGRLWIFIALGLLISCSNASLNWQDPDGTGVEKVGGTGSGSDLGNGTDVQGHQYLPAGPSGPYSSRVTFRSIISNVEVTATGPEDAYQMMVGAGQLLYLGPSASSTQTTPVYSLQDGNVLWLTVSAPSSTPQFNSIQMVFNNGLTLQMTPDTTALVLPGPNLRLNFLSSQGLFRVCPGTRIALTLPSGIAGDLVEYYAEGMAACEAGSALQFSSCINSLNSFSSFPSRSGTLDVTFDGCGAN